MEKLERMLKLKEVMQITSLKRATIYNYIKSGEFPKQVQLTKRSVAWTESSIKRWLESRKKAST